MQVGVLVGWHAHDLLEPVTSKRRDPARPRCRQSFHESGLPTSIWADQDCDAWVEIQAVAQELRDHGQRVGPPGGVGLSAIDRDVRDRSARLTTGHPIILPEQATTGGIAD